METAQIKEIAEVIKTLNLNINSETLENLVSQLKSLLWVKVVFIPIMEDVFFTLIFMTAIVLIYKAMTKEDK